MDQVWAALTTYISRFDAFQMVPDILIVAFVIYQVLKLTRDTRANQVLKGLGILLLASMLSSFLKLTALTWILQYIINNGALVLVIVFQPELRRMLEQIGRGDVLRNTHLLKPELRDQIHVMEELILAMVDLSRAKQGALILIERKTGLGDIVESGTRIDGLVSAPLLKNIFEKDTPLHDGAVIIRSDRVLAAGCVLPLSENAEISRDLGTRHRAALGISEQADVMAFVVSEETGIISMAQHGRLTRHLDPTSLHALLRPVYNNSQERTSALDSLLKWRRKND